MNKSTNKNNKKDKKDKKNKKDEKNESKKKMRIARRQEATRDRRTPGSPDVSRTNLKAEGRSGH